MYSFRCEIDHSKPKIEFISGELINKSALNLSASSKTMDHFL